MAVWRYNSTRSMMVQTKRYGQSVVYGLMPGATQSGFLNIMGFIVFHANNFAGETFRKTP